MPRALDSNLDSFRQLADVGSSRIYLRERVDGKPGRLSVQRVSVGGRLAQWFRSRRAAGTRLLDASDSVATHNRFSEVIRDHYGPEVASALRASIAQRCAHSKPLTGSFVRQSFNLANERSSAIAKGNWRTYKKLCGESSPVKRDSDGKTVRVSLFKARGYRALGQALYARTSKEQLAQVDRFVESNLAHNPMYKDRTVLKLEVDSLLDQGFKALKERGGEGGVALGKEGERPVPANEVNTARLRFRSGLDAKDQSLRNEFFKIFYEAEGLRDASNELLAEAPKTPSEVEDWNARAGSLLEDVRVNALLLRSLETRFHDPGNQFTPELDTSSKELGKDLRDIRDRVFSARTYHAHFLDKHPLSAKSVRGVARTWIRSGESQLTVYKDELRARRAKNSQINNELFDKIDDAAERLRSLDSNLEDKFPADRKVFTSSEVRQIEQDTETSVLAVLTQVDKDLSEDESLSNTNSSDPSFSIPQSAQHSKVNLVNRRKRLLKEENFQGGRMVVRHNFQVGNSQAKIKDQTRLGRMVFQSTQTSARYADDNMLLAGPSDLDSSHLVNVATTELSDEATGETFFEGVRHGVITTEEKDPGIREQILDSKAKELLQASLINNKVALSAALTASRDGSHIELPIVSMSLLTPVKFPKIPERKMLADQLSAFRRLNAGPPVEVEVSNPGGSGTSKVMVKPRFIPFNFGVNSAAVQYQMGWSHVEGFNEKSMAVLVGDPRSRGPMGGLVGEALKKTEIPASRRQEISDLSSQIKEIWQSKSYRKNDGDAYKLQSRIALLSYKLGATSAWNCKSGKDRTSHMDAEVKALATRAHLRGDMPNPGDLGGGSKSMLREFAIRGSGHWIQRNSVGYAGYRTAKLPSNLKRVAGNDPILKELYQGAGSWTKA